jgi:uncharacterized membrane protein
MLIRPFSIATLRRSLQAGWWLAVATGYLGVGYSLIFVLAGAGIIGGLLWQGRAPFVIAAAGAFMLFGPVVLAGFFGIAQAHETRQPTGWRSVRAGFVQAAPALWALALVCGLLLMIFVTDAAILYAYMLGAPAIDFGPQLGAGNVWQFGRWAAVSGAFIAFLLYGVTVFAVPLLCERRAGLVEAVVTSVRAVFTCLVPALLWGCLLGSIIIISILLLPLLPVTLPWLAFSGRALYREVLPR